MYGRGGDRPKRTYERPVIEGQRDLFSPAPAEVAEPAAGEPVPVCTPEIAAIERLLGRIKREVARAGYLAVQGQLYEAHRHRDAARVLWSEVEREAARARRYV